MTMTWGSMKTLEQIQADAKRHNDALAKDGHSLRETDYLAQAKRELGPRANISAVLQRAQRIKLERGKHGA
jgi:hypothetical protein